MLSDLKDYITITIGFDCNSDCVSCMLRDYKDKLKPVDFERFKKLVKEKSKDYSGLTLSGAEVTLNKNLVQFVLYAKRYFKNIRIQTNGRKLSDLKYCEELINAGVNEFYISIYGPNSEIHDKITRRKGSFDETNKALNNLNGLNVKIITNTVVTKYNFEHLAMVVGLISKYKNIKEIELWNYLPMNEEDKYNLMPKISKLIPKVREAICVANKNNISTCLKYFPECLLKEDARHLNNIQSETIIDDLHWEKAKQNYFWNCIFINVCSSKKCCGFPRAYVHKFGWEEDILKPIEVQMNQTD